MRRHLIPQEAFDKLQNESVSKAEYELNQASDVVARAVGKDQLSLHSFNQSAVVYETLDNTYVHAGYQVKGNGINFTDIQELVIDESTRNAKKRSAISEMINSVLVDDSERAKGFFNDVLSMVRWDEACKDVTKDEDKSKKDKFPKKAFGEKKDDGKDKKDFFKKGKKDSKKKNVFADKAIKAGKEIAEAYKVAQDVLGYVEFMTTGPALEESVIKTDERGNVTDIRVPDVKTRNEHRLQAGVWRDLNSRIRIHRNEAAELVNDQSFCKLVGKLKRENAFSNQESLEDTLDQIVREFPSVLYTSQTELADLIGEALVTVGVQNYDDQTKMMMAEGVLRRAAHFYPDRVKQILHLAGSLNMEEGKDPFDHFNTVAESFYSTIDEKFALERKVFEDLYNSIGGLINRSNNGPFRTEASSYANEIAAVLNGEIRPDIALAEQSAQWLSYIVETNLESGVWVVSNKPHLTINGDHPDMAAKAAKGYTPSKDFSGDWGDPAPMISGDNMSYKGKAPEQARNSSWASPSTGGSDTYPNLKNPYVPKAADFTMAGEKGVDKTGSDQVWGNWNSDDVWPGLKNPYVPKEAGGTGGKGFKMKNGEGTDLVVDK